MTVAQPPSWFEPEPSLLIGRAPAKAKPHWSDHSLSFPGRLEGTLHSWLVALNSPKKRPHRKFWGEKPAEKNCKSSGSEKARQLSWGWAQWRRLARCSRAASASPGTPSRSWARASSSARWEEPSSLRSFASWSWLDLAGGWKICKFCLQIHLRRTNCKNWQLCNGTNGFAETASFCKSTKPPQFKKFSC